MIVVAGEALIDLVAEDTVLRPFPGGGPFNTAVALGRLGVPVGYLGRLSDDHFGQMLEDRLVKSAVDLRYALRGPAPTPLAVVHTASNGDAEYSFYLTGTAYSDIAPADLPVLEPEVTALHLGTLALAIDPPASTLETLIEQEFRTRLIVIDPNVRPAVFGDMDTYCSRFERWAGLAHVIKLSSADAAWLYPGQTPESVIERLLSLGPGLILLTLGAHGAMAQSTAASTQVASPAVEVVDTVGAGDAFSAAILHRMHETERLNAAAVPQLDGPELEDLLTFATTVAALQCTRAGASPPTLKDVEAFLGRRNDPVPAANE